MPSQFEQAGRMEHAAAFIDDGAEAAAGAGIGGAGGCGLAAVAAWGRGCRRAGEGFGTDGGGIHHQPHHFAGAGQRVVVQEAVSPEVFIRLAELFHALNELGNGQIFGLGTADGELFQALPADFGTVALFGGPVEESLDCGEIVVDGAGLERAGGAGRGAGGVGQIGGEGGQQGDDGRLELVAFGGRRGELHQISAAMGVQEAGQVAAEVGRGGEPARGLVAAQEQLGGLDGREGRRGCPRGAEGVQAGGTPAQPGGPGTGVGAGGVGPHFVGDRGIGAEVVLFAPPVDEPGAVGLLTNPGFGIVGHGPEGTGMGGGMGGVGAWRRAPRGGRVARWAGDRGIDPVERGIRRIDVNPWGCNSSTRTRT